MRAYSPTTAPVNSAQTRERLATVARSNTPPVKMATAAAIGIGTTLTTNTHDGRPPVKAVGMTTTGSTAASPTTSSWRRSAVGPSRERATIATTIPMMLAASSGRLSVASASPAAAKPGGSGVWKPAERSSLFSRSPASAAPIVDVARVAAMSTPSQRHRGPGSRPSGNSAGTATARTSQPTPRSGEPTSASHSTARPAPLAAPMPVPMAGSVSARYAVSTSPSPTPQAVAPTTSRPPMRLSGRARLSTAPVKTKTATVTAMATLSPRPTPGHRAQTDTPAPTNASSSAAATAITVAAGAGRRWSAARLDIAEL